jgi:hypothetical protein
MPPKRQPDHAKQCERTIKLILSTMPTGEAREELEYLGYSEEEIERVHDQMWPAPRRKRERAQTD